MALVALVAAVGVVVRLSGYQADCYVGVTQLSAELKLSSAGRVVSSSNSDNGGYADCSDPVMSVVLTGTGTRARVEERLKSAGFVDGAGVWTRGGDYVQVPSDEGSNLQVILHAKTHKP